MTNEYSWELEAYENQGNLWLRSSTNSPFRAQQGQLHVYKDDDFPSDPQDDTKAWIWDTDKRASNWDTGLSWGTGWHCAWIAEKPSNGPYTYAVKLITNASMGPDVAK